jgi:hypothetical protein
MGRLNIVALALVAACCLITCKEYLGAEGRYAHVYPIEAARGTGVPPIPYDPDRR